MRVMRVEKTVKCRECRSIIAKTLIQHRAELESFSTAISRQQDDIDSVVNEIIMRIDEVDKKLTRLSEIDDEEQGGL